MTCLPAWLRAAPASCSRRLSSCLFTVIALRARGVIGFVVIDEAHHAGLAKGGDRSAYLDMPDILKALGDPVVLAATATATAPVVAELARVLPITRTVVDETVRGELAARG